MEVVLRTARRHRRIHLGGPNRKMEGEGNVVLRRSDSDCCQCCDGNHVYNISIDVPKIPSLFAGLENESVDDYIHDFLVRHKHEIEGKKVRVTIETVDGA